MTLTPERSKLKLIALVVSNYMSGGRGLLVLLSLVLIVSNIVAAVTVIGPKQDAAFSLEERVKELRSMKSSERGSKVYVTGDTVKLLDEFKSRMLSSDELSNVVGDIYSIARQNGLSIDNASYAPTDVADTDMSRYTISFPIEGKYKDIKKFIYDIETLAGLIVIDEISLSRAGGRRSTVTLRMKVSTFYR
jgi:Tfp pilus assembly protein PilO